MDSTLELPDLDALIGELDATISDVELPEITASTGIICQTGVLCDSAVVGCQTFLACGSLIGC